MAERLIGALVLRAVAAVYKRFIVEITYFPSQNAEGPTIERAKSKHKRRDKCTAFCICMEVYV